MSWLESFSNAIKSSIASKLDKKEANAVFAKKTDLFSKEYSDLKNTPNLSAVAVSGKYRDILDKPKNSIGVDKVDREYLIDQDGKGASLDAVYMLDAYTTIGFGFDPYQLKAYVYMINPESEDGMKCMRYDTSFDDEQIELLAASTIKLYSVYDRFGDIRIIVASSNYYNHDGTAPMFFTNLTEDGSLVDPKHILLEFYESYWPTKDRPKAIVCSEIYEDGWSTNRYVAIMDRPLAESDPIASAYYSSNLYAWTPSDLNVKLNTSPSPYNHIGYDSIIASSYGVGDNQYHFVAWGNSQDNNYKMACSVNGINWNYVEDITSKIQASSLTLSHPFSNVILAATSNGEFITSDDLDTWNIFCKITKHGLPESVSYGENVDSSDYSAKWQLVARYDADVEVIFSSTKFLEDELVRVKIDGYSMSEDVDPFLLTACTADGYLNVYVLARERVYETGRYTGNIFLYTFSYGLVNSDVVPEDLTKKVAEYIRPYMRIPKAIQNPPSSDGTYNLKCEVVDGVPTYTWKEAVPDGDEVSY